MDLLKSKSDYHLRMAKGFEKYKDNPYAEIAIKANKEASQNYLQILASEQIRNIKLEKDERAKRNKRPY